MGKEVEVLGKEVRERGGLQVPAGHDADTVRVSRVRITTSQEEIAIAVEEEEEGKF